ncbi:hypothetical protein [Streptomyces sp. NPDC051677]|uniref:hypothetical protein n=1 Tax=Streptomyces sp. NPDC051677 TaxID=3365669 RepID=UPI0037D4379F
MLPASGTCSGARSWNAPDHQGRVGRADPAAGERAEGGQQQPGHRDRAAAQTVGEAAGRPGRQGADALRDAQPPGGQHALVPCL